MAALAECISWSSQFDVMWKLEECAAVLHDVPCLLSVSVILGRSTSAFTDMFCMCIVSLFTLLFASPVINL